MTDEQLFCQKIYDSLPEKGQECLAPSLDRLQENVEKIEVNFLVFLDMVILLGVQEKAIEPLKKRITSYKKEERIAMAKKYYHGLKAA